MTSILAREQRAFLGRSRSQWGPHLERVRGFLGEGLNGSQGPALILGAGSGLEVPWELAPPGTVGWDADPWSRVRTWLRHRRWAPWVFEDLTGGMAELADVARRSARQPWSGRVRSTRSAARRLAGLLTSLEPDAAPLARWLEVHRPATILAANVMGQFGVLAQRTVEEAFGRRSPWAPDPEEEDPLDEAVQAWTARAVGAFLGALERSGAELRLVHDRGVVFGNEPFALGAPADPWTAQLVGSPGLALEADDPLCGIDAVRAFPGRTLERPPRWLWPVAPGQTHVMEALRVAGIPRKPGSS